ncbi:MAG: caspase family protein [Planctomycetota bacterium]
MDSTRRYALLIGVNDYDEELIPDLKYCADDCRMLREALLKPEGFDDVHVMCDGEPENSLPRFTNVIAQLGKLAEQAQPDDLLLIVFCGHGRELDGQVHLLPCDARLSNLEKTSLSIGFVKQTLQECRAGSKLLFLDACRSGSLGDVDGTTSSRDAGARELPPMSEPFRAQLHAEGIYIVSACGVDERAEESDELKHGVFSYYLAEGLRAEAAPRGEVRSDWLYQHIHDRVREWAKRHDKQQTPLRFCLGAGDPVLIGDSSGQIGPNMLVPSIQASLEEILKENYPWCYVLVSEATHRDPKRREALEQTARNALSLRAGAIERERGRAPRLTPVLQNVADVVENTSLLMQAATALCFADIVIFDLTAFEPVTMLLMGIRAVVRRGVTVATVVKAPSPADLAGLPFIIRELSLVPFAPQAGQRANDPMHPQNLLGEMIEEGLRQEREVDHYLDLPAYEAVRRPVPASSAGGCRWALRVDALFI